MASSSQNIPVPKECSVPGKACYQVWRTNFEIDERYQPIKAVGKGAYGVVCSAKDQQAEAGQASDKVAIKKITNAFENLVDARRTLREMKLLRYLRCAVCGALCGSEAVPAGSERPQRCILPRSPSWRPRSPCLPAGRTPPPPPSHACASHLALTAPDCTAPRPAGTRT